MKVLSGAEPEAQPDYRAQTSGELDKVQSKAVLLNDMLSQAKPGEKMVEGDAYSQVARQVRRVQPRLQQWISDEEGVADQGDDALLNRLLLINDTLNQVLARYKSYREGDYSASATIDASIDPARNGKDAVPTAKVTDLISFDDEPEPQPEPQDAGPSIALPTSTSDSTRVSSPAPTAGPSLLGDDFASLQFGSSSSPAPAPASTSASHPSFVPPSASATATASRQPAVPQSAGSANNTSLLDGFDGLDLAPSTSAASKPLQSSVPAAAPATAPAPAPAPAPAGPKDPFADLDALFK